MKKLPTSRKTAPISFAKKSAVCLPKLLPEVSILIRDLAGLEHEHRTDEHNFKLKAVSDLAFRVLLPRSAPMAPLRLMWAVSSGCGPAPLCLLRLFAVTLIYLPPPATSGQAKHSFATIPLPIYLPGWRPRTPPKIFPCSSKPSFSPCHQPPNPGFPCALCALLRLKPDVTPNPGLAQSRTKPPISRSWATPATFIISGTAASHRPALRNNGGSAAWFRSVCSCF